MIKLNILEQLDIKEIIFAAELDLQLLFKEIDKLQKKYVALPLYPQVTRDISIAINQEMLIGDVLKRIKRELIPYLISIDLKGFYSGKQIEVGFRGLTLSCIYQAPDHTLNTQEVDTCHQKILDILTTEFAVRLR